MCRDVLTNDERKTIKPTERTYTVQTSNDVVHAQQGAQIYIQELDTLLQVKLVDDSLAVLSMRMLCVQMDHAYS